METQHIKTVQEYNRTWVGYTNNFNPVQPGNVYMVRNHQDGYPYINLSYFFFLKIYRNINCFLEKLIGQWILDRDGRGIARDIKKVISTFKIWQKMVTKLGQFKKLKWPFSSLNFFIYYFFLIFYIQNHNFFWKNWLVNEFWTAMGGG